MPSSQARSTTARAVSSSTASYSPPSGAVPRPIPPRCPTPLEVSDTSWDVVGRVEMLAEPALVRGDVEQCRRAGEVGVAGGDRVVDARMLLPREVERAALGDPVPQTRTYSARREAAEQRAQDAVPRRRRDHVVERSISLDKLVGMVACGDH